MAHLIIHERDFIRRTRRRMSLEEQVASARETLFDRVSALPRRYVTHALVVAIAAVVAASVMLS